MIEPPIVADGQVVLRGPEKVRGESRWLIELPDGRRGLLAQQLPELAGDESLRRRYVYECERRDGLSLAGLAEQWMMGPQPDPRDPAAIPPWRLRAEIDGESLDRWLERRAPAPIDEALAMVAKLADLVNEAHAVGLVVRDLEPRNVVVDADGRLWLTDIGFARVDILSTRTASSLMLESSPYAAPEHLRATTIDHRADLYTLGAILWHALTGAVPHSDGPALFRSSDELPPLGILCSGLPDGVEELAHACLDDDPAQRPDSAREVAECLRGRVYHGETALALVTCQACNAPLRPGLRLCLSCGKEAVQFTHAAEDEPDRYELQLVKASEEFEFLERLRRFFEILGEGPPPELNFVIGDARMYSKAERERRQRLPATLFTNLSKATADDLLARMKADGFKVRIKRMDRNDRARRRAGKWALAGAAAAIGGGALLATAAMPLGVLLLVIGAPTALIGGIVRARKPKPPPPGLASLRKSPAALPASDPLVARIASLMDNPVASDVRLQLSELALWIQRLCDRRASTVDVSDLERLAEPIVPLVELVERQVHAISKCDAVLAELDEGVLVRAIATSEARAQPRATRNELLAGLDRLRSVEDQRAQHMRGLLEASSLARRSVELGLAAAVGSGDDEREYRRALAELEAEL